MIEVVRRTKAPESLSRTQSHKDEDVRKALEGDFNGKCYLCEGPTGGTFEVEHLKPQAEKTGFPALRQTWTNLFPAHSQSCNQRRIHWHAANRPADRSPPVEVDGVLLKWPEGGMLDCAAPDARVEWRLCQWAVFGSVSNKVFFEPREVSDLEAVNTAVELRYIHSDEDDLERHGRTIRERIAARYIDIQKKLNPLLLAWPGEPGAVEMRQMVAELKALLAPDTPYAGVLRGTFRRELGVDLPADLITALGLDITPPAPDDPPPEGA